MVDATCASFGEALRRFREDAHLSQPQLAEQVPISQASLSRYETGRQAIDPDTAARLDELLSAGGVLRVLAMGSREPTRAVTDGDAAADEVAALELARRVAASDVGAETLARLETAVDELACQYSRTAPEVLLERIRRYLSYTAALLDKRKTLAEQRRLLVAGGWFSLLMATVQIDLQRDAAAAEYLRTAASLAQHAGHPEIRAWCFETEAWRVLNHGDYPRALELSRASQALAPAGSSIAVQSLAQEGRAMARMGRTREMREIVGRVHKLVSPMGRPDHPEHHYRYDPDKVVQYTATTLAWGGDPAGEEYARELIARLQPSPDIEKWPRRVASASLDLALTLVTSQRFDEASDAATNAILSGQVVPSNRWRALEVVRSFEGRKVAEAKELREVYTGTFKVDERV